MAKFESALTDRLFREESKKTKKEQIVNNTEQAQEALNKIDDLIYHGVMEEQQRLRQQIVEQGLARTMQA